MRLLVVYLIVVVTTLFDSNALGFTCFAVDNQNWKGVDAKECLRRQMIGGGGGRGWDNSDYLGGLSGDEDERKKVQDDYEDFTQRREAFKARQEEILKSPQGRAFFEQQQEQQRRRQQPEGSDSFGQGFGIGMDDEFEELEVGSGGGTRMSQLMAQSKQFQRRQQQMGSMMGFEQKFAVPLDDDEEEENEDSN